MVFVRWVINALFLLLLAYILPGVGISGVYIALIVSLVLGIVNALVRPVLLVLTLPINVLTLGLFTLVINGLLVLFVSTFIKGFYVSGLGSAIAFSVLLWLCSWLTNWLLDSDD
jgi:putative membrane protein